MNEVVPYSADHGGLNAVQALKALLKFLGLAG